MLKTKVLDNKCRVSAFDNLIFKPGFHVVVSLVSVVSVIRKKLTGQMQLYGNLPSNAQYKRNAGQIELVVRDRINSICPMNFFRTTDTTDTTDTTIWKPGFKL